jgi:hypothetical protein
MVSPSCATLHTIFEIQRRAGEDLRLAEDERERVKLFLRRAAAPLVGVLTKEKVRFGLCRAEYEYRRWPNRGLVICVCRVHTSLAHDRKQQEHVLSIR